MRHLRQAWAAAASPAAGRFVHVWLPPDADEAHRLLTALSRRHQARLLTAAGEPSEYDHARLHDLVAKGGFTHHPVHGASPANGFMVSYHAPSGSGAAVEQDLADLGPEHIAAHRQAIAEHLSKPDSYQGGWLDRADNRVYLDASRHFTDEHKARAFALDEKQKAYFDVDQDETTYLHPKLDPQAMSDHDAWKLRYAPHGEEPPPEYRSYAHLYPVTNEQHEFWDKRGEHLASREGKPAWLAGRPVGPWLSSPQARRDNAWSKRELGW